MHPMPGRPAQALKPLLGFVAYGPISGFPILIVPWSIRRYCERLTGQLYERAISSLPKPAAARVCAERRHSNRWAGYELSVASRSPAGIDWRTMRLTSGRHELGCHTFHHYPAWETAPKTYESSVTQNREAAAALLPREKMICHSYPISYPRPASKRRIARYFAGCRGGGQCINTGAVDLNYLSSFFIEQCHGNLSAIEQIVSVNIRSGGWLIFSTHDVSDHPTRFGCTPAFFEQIVASSVRSGATILPMGTALQRMTGRPEAPGTR